MEGPERGSLESRKIKEADFGYIVAAASLAHDIGNPPFGHAGETAIQDWYVRDDVASKVLKGLSRRQTLDLQRFDGNAQGFRVLTNTQMYRGKGGLCLTCATLGAYTKYPCASDMTDADSGDAGSKKSGFFESERHYFDEIARETGLISRRHGAPVWARHPLAFLVEAADDICYNVIDLEDGYKLGLVPFDRLKEFLQPISELSDADLENSGDADDMVAHLRAKVIGKLISQVAKVFLENEVALRNGTIKGDLLSKTPAAETIAGARKYLRKDVYASQQNLEMEIAGFDVKTGLLEAFTFSLLQPPNSKLAPSVTPHKGQKIRENFLRGISSNNTAEALHLVTDQVAGMKDSFAVKTYKKIKGLSL